MAYGMIITSAINLYPFRSGGHVTSVRGHRPIGQGGHPQVRSGARLRRVPPLSHNFLADGGWFVRQKKLDEFGEAFFLRGVMGRRSGRFAALMG